MNDHETDRIAAAMNMLRPDWPTRQLKTLLKDARISDRPRRDVCVALAWIAAEPASHNPYRVLEAGPWWKAAGVEAATTHGKLHVYGDTEGDPREVCGECSLHRSECAARARTNGHVFRARLELPPTDPNNMWMKQRSASYVQPCLAGDPAKPCRLPVGHGGKHELPPPPPHDHEPEPPEPLTDEPNLLLTEETA